MIVVPEQQIRETAADRVVALLARPTRQLIAEIDGLRLIAISSVVLGHIWARIAFWIPNSTEHMGITERIVDQGYFGVMLFFVLSGFILSLPFAEHALAGGRKVDLKFYFVRRVVRIEPPYFINILVVTSLTLLLGYSLGEVLPHLLSSLVYLHNLIFQIHYPGASKGFYLNGVTWSLEIEVQFYILAPLVCGVFYIRHTILRRGLMLGVMIGGALSSQLLLATNPIGSVSILGYVDYFAAGFLLADIYVLKWKDLDDKSVAADIIGVLAAVALLCCLLASPVHWVASPPGPGLEWSVLAPFLVLIFYASVFRGRRLNRLMTNRWIVVAGGMCYSFYLYHSLVIGAMFSRVTLKFYNPYHPFVVNFFVQCVLILPVVAIVCCLCYLVFEQPFMRRELQRRVLKAMSRVPTPELLAIHAEISNQ
jgi:peptidoglycan/LPS O-acetylase OafA/YrhL